MHLKFPGRLPAAIAALALLFCALPLTAGAAEPDLGR